MALQLTGIPDSLFQGADPFLRGLRSGTDFKQSRLDAYKQQLMNKQLEAELPFAQQLAQANATYKQAMANYLGSPAKQVQGLSPLGKTFMEEQLLGNMPLNNKDMSQYETYRQKISQDPVLGRQALSAQEISNEINDIDTTPLEKFAGLGGRIKGYQEKAKGALSSLGFDVKPSKEWRDYNSYMSINKNAIMDAIRKALSTSVVPGYVAQTLQPMVDPSSPIWNDPEQVKQNISTLKQWIHPYAAGQTQAYSKGIPKSLEESKERHQNAKREALPQLQSNEKVAPVTKYLAKDMPIPNFQSAEQEMNWFKGLEPSVQQAILIARRKKEKGK